MTETDAAETDAPPPSLTALFLAFLTIGLTSFGGGLSGWIHRDFVGRRRWISEADFTSGLALAQAMPGVNVVNLSIWVGFALRGSRGALLAVTGVLAAPLVAIILIGVVYGRYGGLSGVHAVLAGVTAAAIGLTLTLGWRTARRAARDRTSLSLLLATFATVGLLHWPMLPVVAVLVPLSLLLAFRRGLR
ncbi:MAG TPA: chromate transporter [Aliidongia sp.]|uniref:chromate transporter n=1 Tax=Aliidongia sp. TaxID=1914230 RepID=UPI002DDD76F3|nr:chromate transporter [Aliidongia sp.]HEV2677001.1 chromate transporter [Aliidongia sp.]